MKKDKNNNSKKNIPIIYVVVVGIILAIIGFIIGIHSYNNPMIDERFSYKVNSEQKIDDSYYIEGVIKSNTLKEFNVVSVEFYCYDKNNNIIGIASDQVTHLEPEGTWNFKATGSFGKEDVKHCDLVELFAGENNY